MRKNLPRAPQFTVNVTSEVMELSRGRDSSHCMIAMAVKDAQPKVTSISVDLQTIRFSDPEKRLRYTYLTPRHAQVAIIDFDLGKMPEPFSFRLSGGHVTTMFSRQNVATPRGNMTLAQQAALSKARDLRPGQTKTLPDHPELTKLQLTNRGEQKSVPQPIGGKVLPRIPLARTRAFGLRGLVR